MNSQRKSPSNEQTESGGTSRGDNVSDQVCLYVDNKNLIDYTSMNLKLQNTPYICN